MDFKNEFFDSDMDEENDDKSSQSSGHYGSNVQFKNTNAGLSGTKKHDWFLLKEFDNETEAFDCLKLKMPYSITRNSAANTYCKLKIETRLQKHRLKLSHKRCKGHKIDDNQAQSADAQYKKCPVQYKFVQCKICSIYQIFQYGKHSVDCLDIIGDGDEIHPDAQVFGIHPRVKLIIQNLLIKNPTYYTTQQISLYLNQKHIKETLMKGLIMPDKESISHFLRSYAKNPNRHLTSKDDMNDSESLLDKDQIADDYELENETALFAIDSNDNENHSWNHFDELLNNNNTENNIQNQIKASTSVNTEKNVNELSDFGLFESFNIFFLKLKDEARLFNYLCFMMLQKEKKSIAYVKQMETLNVGKLNFFTKELIYLYGLPNEIRYSDTNLSSAFQEINCLKNEMTDIERSSWLNSVNSYFEEFYSQFDILNFSSKWNEKGASFKSILTKSDHIQVLNNMKRNLEATKEDEHLNVKKMKFSQTSASPSKSLLGLNRKNNDNQATRGEEIESSNQFMSKNKILSDKTELHQYEALKRIHEDEIRHHEQEIQRHLDSIKRHRFYQDELENKRFTKDNLVE